MHQGYVGQSVNNPFPLTPGPSTLDKDRCSFHINLYSPMFLNASRGFFRRSVDNPFLFYLKKRLTKLKNMELILFFVSSLLSF